LVVVSHRLIAARVFQIWSFAIGIPSLALGIFMTGMAIEAHASPQPSGASSGNQAVDLLMESFRFAARSLSFLGGVLEWFAILAAVLAFGLAAYAVVLFFVGKGIRAKSSLARILGIVLFLPTLLSSATTLVSLREPVPMAFALVAMGVAGYVVWALGFQFDKG
jgi:hypothetical protein